VPLNSFYQGGLFDFAHLPSDALEEIQVARGPQSAVYGSYAMGGAVSIETRNPENGPALDVLAEGGTHDENRVAVSGETMISRGWGISASLSNLLANGPVPNSDYRDQNALLAIEHRLIPPTAGTTTVDPEFTIDVVLDKARPWEPAPSISNSLGFGGHNGSVIIGPA